MILGLILIVCAVGFGLFLRFVYIDEPYPADAGYIYFISAVGGDEMDPPAPIKVGKTHRNPYRDRLPELQTGSAQELEVVFAFFADDIGKTEGILHRKLKSVHIQGEWYERDTVMAYIDYLVGNAN